MKKKIYVLLLIIVIILTMVGCAPSESENISGEVKELETNGADEDTENKDTEDKDAEDEIDAINEEIVNDDNFRAVLVEIKKENDDIWGNSIKIKFELENKSEQTVEVQAREVSIDGKMVNESTSSMSQEISAGKTADGTLTINEFEDIELPKLEEELEMILHVFSWDDMDYRHDYPLKISINK